MKKLALTLAAFLVAAPLLANRPKFIDSVRVLKDSGQNICTTTSINKDKGYWLTAAHCIGGYDTAGNFHTSYTLTIDKAQVFVVLVDIKNDLAVLETPYLHVNDLKLADDMLDFTDDVMVGGHPLGWDSVVFQRGYVANPKVEFTYDNVKYEWMLLNLLVAGGNSGSAIVDKDGDVVSVVQVTWGQGFNAMTGGVPQDTLKRVVGKYFRRN